jgi:ribosomal RNA-processing protein 8
MAHTPFENNSVEIAVFVLSLMGINLGDFISEANRILTSEGILLIIEVESRIENRKEFVDSIQSHGFKFQKSKP